MADIDPPWWSGQPSNKKASAKSKDKPAKATGTWGEKIQHAFGLTPGGRDPTNVSSHPDVKIEYENPNPKRADDKRSTLRKLGDEFAGTTVGGNEIRRIKKVTKASPGGGGGGGGGGGSRKTSAVATPKRTVAKTAKASVPSASRPMRSDRMEAAGYTTSAPNRNWSGFTYGSKSSSKPKVAAAKKTKTGKSHNPKGLSWFNGKD